MTNKIEIGTKTFEIELPFHLDVLEKAADAIDRSNQAVEEMGLLENADGRIPLSLLVKALGASVEALHIAVAHTNPKVTLEDIRSLVSLEDVGRLSRILNSALLRAGLAEVEV